VKLREIDFSSPTTHNSDYFVRSRCGAILLSSMSKKSELSRYLSELGRKGGKATAKKLTSEQRKQNARKAAKARWTKQKGIFSRDTET
jgi:hypothetical protein